MHDWYNFTHAVQFENHIAGHQTNEFAPLCIRMRWVVARWSIVWRRGRPLLLRLPHYRPLPGCCQGTGCYRQIPSARDAPIDVPRNERFDWWRCCSVSRLDRWLSSWLFGLVALASMAYLRRLLQRLEWNHCRHRRCCCGYHRRRHYDGHHRLRHYDGHRLRHRHYAALVL